MSVVNFILPNGGGSGLGTGATVNDIQCNVAVGASPSTAFVPGGTTLEQYIRTTRTTVFEPTEQNPSITRVITGSIYREVGETITETVTLTLNRGNILGKLVNGIWNAGVSQNPRSGVATAYNIDGAPTAELANSKEITRKLGTGANLIVCSIDYAAGPQPLNSDNVNSLELDPEPAGNKANNLVIFASLRRFYGSVPAASANGAAIRNLPASELHNNNSFTLNTGTNNKIFEIAIPFGNNLVSVIDADALNLDVTNSYVLTAISTVPDADGTNQNYKVYRMTNASTYSANHRHNVITS